MQNSSQPWTQVFDKLEDLEKKVDALREEMPELRLVKKIVFTGMGMGMAALVVSLLGLVLKKG